jgi:hypothetical protein
MSAYSLEAVIVKADSSKVVLGTMRMNPSRQSIEDWAEFLVVARALGVARIHCSDEYESFPFFLKVLAAARRTQENCMFEFVVKLAEPHFGEMEFVESRLKARLDSYRSALGVDRLDCVQWMWRGDLKDEASRCSGFSGSAERIAVSMGRLKDAGVVRAFQCFPYTVGFAEAALGHSEIDGLAIYRNPYELEYEPAVSQATALGKSVLVIRPFKAGEALANGKATDLIRFSARLPVVDGVVVSCSTVRHLAECVEAASTC